MPDSRVDETIHVLFFYQFDHRMSSQGRQLIESLIGRCPIKANGHHIVLESLKSVCEQTGIEWTISLLDRLRGVIESGRHPLAFAILVEDARPASSAGNLFFEVGYWLGRREDRSVRVIRHGQVDPPSNLDGTIIQEVKSDIEAAGVLRRHVEEWLRSRRDATGGAWPNPPHANRSTSAYRTE